MSILQGDFRLYELDGRGREAIYLGYGTTTRLPHSELRRSLERGRGYELFKSHGMSHREPN